MSDYLDPNNEELLNDFFEEARIQIEQLEQNILVLENDATDKDCIDELFRAAHTLKGAAATVAITELADLTHVLEDVLDEIREGRQSVTHSVVDALLVAVDVIKSMVDCRMEGSVYEDQGIEELKVRLHRLTGETDDSAAAPVDSAAAVNSQQPIPSEECDPALDENELEELLELLEGDQKLYQVRVFFDESALMNTIGGIQVYAALKNEGTILKTTPDFEALNEDVFYPDVFYFVASSADRDVIQDLVTITDVTTGSQISELNENSFEHFHPAPAETPASAPVQKEEPETHTVSDESANAIAAESKQKAKTETDADKKNKKQNQSSILRVDSKKIDSLLNMISESVINKSAINQVSDVYHQLIGEFRSLNSKLETEVFSLFDVLEDYSLNTEDENNSGENVTERVQGFRDRCLELFDTYSHFEDKFKKNADDLKNSTQKLALNTSSLQEGIMQIRMVPISTLFARFPRLVRDLSHSLNKKTDLILEGEDTELDKSIVEDLLDPLIHCVRNSLDHGLESAEKRAAAGKPETGTVIMRAGNEGSMIVIEVSDDGAGIDAEKVRQKAIEKGLIAPDAVLNEQEVHNLIFMPGFSTSDTVSSISGRGVGLDVVRTQIEKLKGTIQVNSRKGVGTSFIIRLPLTLAIIQGLLIRSVGSKFVIPINSVIDSHRILKEEIKLIEGREVLKIREELIYILRLNRIFGLPSAEKKGNSYEYMVIVGNEERKMGLIVDSLLGEEDVVIKPLKDKYSKTFGMAGATILGDGSVSLIIDVQQLLDQVHALSGEADVVAAAEDA